MCILTLEEPPPRCFPEAGRAFDFDWAPNGRRLVVTGPGPLPMRILDTRTGRVRVLVSLNDPALRSKLSSRGQNDPVQFVSPEWSPSGRYVAAGVAARGDVPMIFDLAGRPVAIGHRSMGGNADDLTWSADSDVLLYSPGFDLIHPRRWDLRALYPADGEDVVVAHAPPRPFVTSFAVSPSGRWVALAESSSTIRFIDLLGDEPARSLRWHSEFVLEDWGVVPS